jgi:EAL domain-containing protein (putative c-di-GMP-specific phosphodiesterase class I)
MTTTAEGVETDSQKQFLSALGCDEGQGELFSVPVAVEEVPGIIAAWSAERILAA